VDVQSILVSRLNPRINRTWLAVPEEGTPALASTEFLILQPERPSELGALWLATRDSSFMAELLGRVTGTSGSHQRVRPDDALSIPVPDFRKLGESQRSQAFALLLLMRQKEKESAGLVTLRDGLLPDLLCGRISVPAREAVRSA
jgi:type I restriction enzyme S subunit